MSILKPLGEKMQNDILYDSVDFGGFPQLPVLSISEFRLLNPHVCMQSLWSLHGGVRVIFSPTQPPACLWGFLSRLQALSEEDLFYGLSPSYCVMC